MEADNIVFYTHASKSGAALYVYRLVKSFAESNAGNNGTTTLIAPKDFEYSKLLNHIDQLRIINEIPSMQLASGKVEKILVIFQQSFTGFNLVNGIIDKNAIVHINFPGFSFISIIKFWLWKRNGALIVMTIHDPVPHQWMLPDKLIWIEKLFLKWSIRQSNYLVVHNARGKIILQELYKISPDMIEVIPHGDYVSEVELIPSSCSEKIVFLVFGTLRKNKGIYEAIAAFQKIKRTYSNIELVIAGNSYHSEEDYWRVCSNLIEDDPSRIQVIHRYVPDNEVHDILSSVDILLLPYTSFESQSGVASLGLSFGKMVLATKVGGLADLIEDGLIYPIAASDTESIAKSMSESVLLGKKVIREYGLKNRDRYLKSYNWNSIAERYKSFYKRIVLQKQKNKSIQGNTTR